MEFNKLDTFINTQVLEAKKEGDDLLLTFPKKILFINKKVTYRISAKESLVNLSLKTLPGAKLLEVKEDKKRLSLTFTTIDKCYFTLAFKVQTIAKI